MPRNNKYDRRKYSKKIELNGKEVDQEALDRFNNKINSLLVELDSLADDYESGINVEDIENLEQDMQEIIDEYCDNIEISRKNINQTIIQAWHKFYEKLRYLASGYIHGIGGREEDKMVEIKLGVMTYFLRRAYDIFPREFEEEDDEDGANEQIALSDEQKKLIADYFVKVYNFSNIYFEGIIEEIMDEESVVELVLLLYENDYLDDKHKAELGLLLNIAKKHAVGRLLYLIGEKETKSTEMRELLFLVEFGGEEERLKQLIKISKDLSPDIAENLYYIVYELVETAEKIEIELKKENFIKDSETTGRIREELLAKTSALIDSYSDKNFNDEKIDDKTIKQLIRQLDQTRIDIMILASTLVAFKKQGNSVGIEDIKDMQMEISVAGDEISRYDRDYILEIARANWGDKPEGEAVLMQLEEAITKSEKQKCYILKYKEKVVGFLRFEPRDDGTVYAGSFNVAKDARGFGLGEEMMMRALKEEGEKNILVATASTEIPAGTAYVERAGFVVDGYISDYHKTGVPRFTIRADRGKNRSYAYRNDGKKIEDQITIETIVEKHERTKAKDLDSLVGENVIVLKFDIEAEQPKYRTALKRLLEARDDKLKVTGAKQKDKYVMTRYFYPDKTSKNVRYLVFEKK